MSKPPKLDIKDDRQTYNEFKVWAVQLIADSVLRHGFSELRVVIDQIVRVVGHGFRQDI